MPNLIHGTFISEKINKIRWRLDPFNNPHSFITGSWDNYPNSIKLWDFQENLEDSDVYPYIISNYEFEGDVTECKVRQCSFNHVINKFNLCSSHICS